MNPRTFRLFLVYLGVALFLNAGVAYGQAWQNLFVHAGETKSITAPAGKLLEFLPAGGTPTSGVAVKLDFGNGNVVPQVGLAGVSPPNILVGPITITLVCSKTAPNTTPASFAIVTYRLKDNQ